MVNVVARDGRRFSGTTSLVVVREMQAMSCDAQASLADYVSRSVERAREYEGKQIPDPPERSTDEQLASWFLATMWGVGLLLGIVYGGAEQGSA